MTGLVFSFHAFCISGFYDQGKKHGGFFVYFNDSTIKDFNDF